MKETTEELIALLHRNMTTLSLLHLRGTPEGKPLEREINKIQAELNRRKEVNYGTRNL